MALILDDLDELKYYRNVVRLPYDKKEPLKNTFIGLLIRDPNQSINTLNNKLIYRDNKHARYFLPFRYQDKIFTTTVRQKLTNDDIKNYTAFFHTHKLAFYSKSVQVKDKNIIVDTSPVNVAFMDHCTGKSYPMLCESYIKHLGYYLDKVCGLKQKSRYLFLNTKDWGISAANRSKVTSANQKMMNPLSMIYELLKKKPDALKELDSYTLVIFDSDIGYFKWSIKNRDKKTFAKIYALVNKFKSKDVNLDLSVDTEEETKAKEEIPDEETDEKIPESVPHRETPSEVIPSDEITEDEMEIAKKAIDDNFDDIARTVAKNKRMQKLREKQRSIKVDNISMADLEDEKPIDYTIETNSIADKIFTPNPCVKNVRFNNMNRSYNKNIKNRDIMNVFRSLNEKKRMPVMITSIKKQNTSTAMDLKETWTVKMQSEDGMQHSLTVDIPIVYDDNYLYLGGNRKQFVNQQILKPLIKISPDTVQVCTNYNKIFMYRYGDVVSPKVTIFKKIIANNPSLFKVKRGNGAALNHEHMTSIEYDSIAKDFVEITIRGKGIGLKFDQTFFDKLRENKQLEDIGDDDFLYCIWDSRPNAKVKAFVCPINEDAREENGSNDRNGPIDVFAEIFENETGKKFWDLQGPKDKPGKRFMYSSCTVMGKKIPTIILLGYFEGITKVMNKEGVKYEFSDKRKQIDLGQSIIQFKDGYLIYKNTPTEHGLLMSGLSLVDTKSYSYSDFDTQMPYLDIFAAKYGNRLLASGLDAYYDNMIDPITKEILGTMDLPTDFVQLMLAANDLLSDNAYSSELSLTEFRVRNLEMISAYLYKSVSNAYSNYRRHMNDNTPAKISIPKGEVIKEILMSNVVEDVSVINPVTEKEKQHAITCKGPSGINLERAYTKQKRCFDKTMTGCMTISTSPDANCGVVRELTVEPKITNSRGFIDCDQKPNDMNQNRLFGYAELVNGVGVAMDDAIRTAMASKQN